MYWTEYANYLNADIFHQRNPSRGSDGKNWQICVLTANEANERRKMKEANENSVAKAGSSSGSTICSGALQRIPQLGNLRETQRPGRKPQHMSQQLMGLGQDQGNSGQAMDQRNSGTHKQVQENRCSRFCGSFSWNGVLAEAVTQPA